MSNFLIERAIDEITSQQWPALDPFGELAGKEAAALSGGCSWPAVARHRRFAAEGPLSTITIRTCYAWCSESKWAGEPASVPAVSPRVKPAGENLCAPMTFESIEKASLHVALACEKNSTGSLTSRPARSTSRLILSLRGSRSRWNFIDQCRIILRRPRTVNPL